MNSTPDSHHDSLATLARQTAESNILIGQIETQRLQKIQKQPLLIVEWGRL